jgi:hypothetical protein
MSGDTLVAHRIVAQDLEECLGVHTAHIGSEIVGHERALSAWRALVKSAAFNSVVIETGAPVAGHRILAFGASAFVSPEFAQQEISDPKPGLNGRVIASIDAGRPIVLSHADLRFQNTCGGLCQVILFSTWRRDCLTAGQVTQIRVSLAKASVDLYSGYRLERMLFEAIDETDLEDIRSTKVWQVISDYAAFHARNPANGWSRKRSLAVIDKVNALSLTGSAASMFFYYTPPILGLKHVDQQLLGAALEGLTDHELSHALGLNVQTVKKRWASVFDQVWEVMPSLLPDSTEGIDRRTRGPQKRHHLLAYLRHHPEELRPFVR